MQIIIIVIFLGLLDVFESELVQRLAVSLGAEEGRQGGEFPTWDAVDGWEEGAGLVHAMDGRIILNRQNKQYQ